MTKKRSLEINFGGGSKGSISDHRLGGTCAWYATAATHGAHQLIHLI